MKHALLIGSLTLLGCGGRSALPGEPVDGSPVGVGDAAQGGHPFCSGAAKVSIDGTVMQVTETHVRDFISAASYEGAHVSFVAAASPNETWEVTSLIHVAGLDTITDRPLPATLPIGPPEGLAVELHVRKPAGCTSTNTCELSTVIWTESDQFSGEVTVAGEDYRGPLRLRVCLSGKTDYPHPTSAAQVFTPEVAIPYWRMPGPP